VFLSVLFSSFSFAQKEFEARYNKTVQLIIDTRDSLEYLISSMKNTTKLSDVQKAQINFIKTKMYTLYEIDPLFHITTDLSTDSIEQLPLLSKAENYIVQSRPDEGIPLIFEFLQTVDESSDSATYAKIYLAEAYREKQEYLKGMEIVYGLLEHKAISLKNKAFAYNRLAALYSEYGDWSETKGDSVIKYSNLCIKISTNNNFTGYLAASQNELAFIYREQGQNKLSLEYGLKAFDNFIEIKSFPQAMNTAINLSLTYKKTKELGKAGQIINEVLGLVDVRNNENLFFRSYLLLADINADQKKYLNAYEYLSIAHKMQSRYYHERIDLQINEMSAKYEADIKEKKIGLLKKDNEIQLLQLSGKNQLIVSLSIGIIVFIVLSGFIFVLYRKRDIAYKRLVDKNLDLISCENSNPVEQKQENDFERNGEEDTGLRTLAIEFDTYLKKEKPFLFSEISYDEVCKKLNTNRTYLSKAINKSYDKSFLEVINYFRIKEASLYLSNPKYNHISIEGIGQMTGFNYKAAFYSNFKKQVGITPLYFRKNSQNHRQI
jgi:AraC-like DNA-binding protein